jgi:hypothetical protein
MNMTQPDHDWRVSGSYFEACNCDAICPCRRQGGLKLTTGSTYGVCQFALSWRIARGHLGSLDLTGLSVVLAGFYRDDEPGKPWRVCLYVDERATAAQHDALAGIFLGRLGGTPARNFAGAIREVDAIRRAAIELDHRPGRWFMRASDFVTVKATTPVAADLAVSCGIPGHDHPGEELRADVMRIDDDVLHAEVHGRCGFASDFDYAADAGGTQT